MKLTAESTVFNDDKVQEKFAELVVDADGIRTEVSKKVGNDEVISRINQSAESVKIQASKVEVDGTLIVGKDVVDSAKAAAISTAASDATTKANEARNYADNFVTYVSASDGIKVHSLNDTSNYIKINSDGTDVYKGGKSVSMYGDTARVGEEDGAHIKISGSELLGTTGDVEYFAIDTTGGTLNTKFIIARQDCGTAQYAINLSSDSKWSSIATGGNFYVDVTYVYRDTGATTHRTSSISLKFTKGTSSTSNAYIKYDGYNTITITSSAPTLSGYTCYGKSAIAYFFKSSITPLYRFGNDVAKSGGAYSFLMGTGTKSNSANQLVVGQYNDNDSLAYFIVGNGSSDTARSNAFSVTRDGWVYCDALDVNGSAYIPALHLGEHSTAVGSIVSSYLTAQTAISAGNTATLCTISLPAGTWVITGVVQFPNGNDETYRRMRIARGSSSAEPPNVQVSAISGYPTTLTSTVIENITSTTTFYLNVMAGKTLTLNAGSVGGINYIKAVRIE